MAELSSNWKKLQAKMKGESDVKLSTKRKPDSKLEPPSKKAKVVNTTTRRTKSNGSTDNSSLRRMGAVHSSELALESSKSSAPSLALWAEDNDISAEALAEAYDLGVKDNSMLLASEKDKVNRGLSEGLEVGKYVALDCEMVGVGPGGYESSLARVSIVDFHGRQVYDSYVKQREAVTNWRTAVSGITRKEMRFAREFEEVQQEVYDVLKDRILIGHDVKHDLSALQLSHPPRDTRDTSKYPGFKKYGHGRKPALRVLAQEILNIDIQTGSHSSVEDARVTMLLFRRHKSGFDMDQANRYAPKLVPGTKSTGKKSKKDRRT